MQEKISRNNISIWGHDFQISEESSILYCNRGKLDDIDHQSENSPGKYLRRLGHQSGVSVGCSKHRHIGGAFRCHHQGDKN
jgi:hypothetical protein